MTLMILTTRSNQPGHRLPRVASILVNADDEFSTTVQEGSCSVERVPDDL